MNAATAASLEWVLIDGAPHHVAEFASIPVRQRPRASCPQCGRRITLKLGRVRRYHAAHAAGQTCPAIRAETALHINCKLSLAAVLSRATDGRTAFEIEQRCIETGCDRILHTTWLEGWDSVDVESRADTDLRPDITLSLHGAPVGAIEIVVTNAISAEKAQALGSSGLRWIEVEGAESLATAGGWSLDSPLPVLRSSDRGDWRCTIHAAEHATATAVRASAMADPLDVPRESRLLKAARVVDLYYAGGARERFIYRVELVLFDSGAAAARLARGNREIARFALDDPRDGDVQALPWDAIRNALHDDVARLRRNDETIIDSPMRWAVADAAENIVNEALFDRTPWDATPLATTFPRRWFYVSARGQWFLPHDMRDVRWDRPSLDPFAPHPASRRARGAVREFAAPEGSWSTPIFARPPVAAMFSDGIGVSAGRDGVAVIELPATTGKRRRAIVVIERQASDDDVRARAAELTRRDVDAVWLSSPRDWTPALADVAWLPAGRDQHAHGAVQVDGVGVFRADAFARALAKGDPRLSDNAIRRAIAPRVQRLRAR